MNSWSRLLIIQQKQCISRHQTRWVRKTFFYPPKLTEPNKIIFIPETNVYKKNLYHDFHIHTVTDPSKVLGILLAEYLRHLHSVIYIRTSFRVTAIRKSSL